jgi:hypothetical protein
MVPNDAGKRSTVWNASPQRTLIQVLPSWGKLRETIILAGTVAKTVQAGSFSKGPAHERAEHGGSAQWFDCQALEMSPTKWPVWT